MVALKFFQTAASAQDLTTCAHQLTVSDLSRVNQEHPRLETGSTTKSSSLPPTVFEAVAGNFKT